MLADAPSASSRALTVAVAAEHEGGDWDAFVSSHPAASGYHAWGWRGVFRRAFGHEPTYLVARREAVIHGVLPLVQINSLLFGRSLTSLPFLSYGGVVADTDDVGQMLIDASVKIARSRRCRHVELRHVNRRFPLLPCKQHKVAMWLRLGEAMWERFDRKVRNQIRKAQKSGLRSHRGGIELLDAFYEVFARNMRDLGTPVYGPRFFEEVLRTFAERTQLHIVRLGGTTVAAGLTYRSGEVVEVPWASSIRDYNGLCPNHLLYWNIIESASESGCKTLDLGRSTPGEGTYKFKEQWGAMPVRLYWEYPLCSVDALPDASPSNPKYQLAIALWKRLPLAVATCLGPRVVRSIP